MAGVHSPLTRDRLPPTTRDRDTIDGLPIVNAGATSLLALVFLMVLTDRLIWHTRLSKAEADRDRWQNVALEALGVADKLTVHSEVTTAIVAALPDPDAEGGTANVAQTP